MSAEISWTLCSVVFFFLFFSFFFFSLRGDTQKSWRATNCGNYRAANFIFPWYFTNDCGTSSRSCFSKNLPIRFETLFVFERTKETECCSDFSLFSFSLCSRTREPSVSWLLWILFSFSSQRLTYVRLYRDSSVFAFYGYRLLRIIILSMHRTNWLCIHRP